MSSSSKSSKVISSSSPLNLPYIPDDLLLNCLARVSRLYYPTLSLVSKRFRSLLGSLELYKTRTRLGCTESCLYLCLWLPGESNSLRWFTLSRRPVQISNPKPKTKPKPKPSCFLPHRSLKNSTRKKEMKSRENILVSIPACKTPFKESEGVIAAGCNIYKIGGYEDNDEPSSRVYLMDCRSHMWHEAPSMQVARKYPCVSVLDGKIYVVESIINFDSGNLMECLNPKTGKWEDVPSSGAEICGTYVTSSVAMEGKIYLHGDKKVVYNSKENRWDAVRWRPFMFEYSHLSCEIDNVFYCWDVELPGKIKWYDSEEISWRFLKGLEKMPRISLVGDPHCALVSNGGKIALCWEEDGCSNEKRIWCAEISLERRSKKDIYMVTLIGAMLCLQSPRVFILSNLFLLLFKSDSLCFAYIYVLDYLSFNH